MVWAPFLVFALALFARPIARWTRGAAGWCLAALPAALCIWFVGFLPIEPGEQIRATVEWAPGLGAELSFSLDGLSATFAILITGIGALILVYTGGYMAKDPRRGTLFSYLLLFLGAMLGLVLSDNLISLFVFWELTSVTSYLMIGFDHEKPEARAAALKALIVTGGGGLALLGGFVLMGIAGGDLGLGGADAFSLSALRHVDVRGHPLYAGILVLVLLGAFSKSAQFPFSFWLPAAMAGPTPVSAFLHSATMVKAGIYLLARLHPVLGRTDAWEAALVAVGGVTMLGAAIAALAQHDLKRILAFTTLSVLGMLTMLLGAEREKAITAAAVLLVAHALYKASLFMVAGSIDHETGTRDIRVLRGLRLVMPVTFAAGLLAALSQAGAPPMVGFVGKELFYGFRLDAETFRVLAVLVAVATNVALVAAALLVALRPFLGSLGETPKKPHEAPPSMLLGPVVLGAATLFVGLFPGLFDRTTGNAMASAIAGYHVDMHLKLWHGASLESLSVLALSGVTLLLGIRLYNRMRGYLAPLSELCRRVVPYGPAAAYEWALPRLYTGAGWLTRRIQTGYLRQYIMVIVVAAVVTAAPPLVRSFARAMPARGDAPRVYEVIIVLLGVAGAVAVPFFRSRLAGVAAVGVTGAALAFLFMLYGAPDLAITQVMVETLSVILFVLVFSGLPRIRRRSTVPRRLRDGAVAVAAGAFVALLVATTGKVSMDPSVARYFSESSYPLAHGRNVVNVILVDFRALDTMGEISVVVAAAFGVVAMLLLLPRREEKP